MEEKKSLWTKLVQSVDYTKLIALIALIVIFTFFAVSGESFRSFDTAVSILDASYYIGFLAIGVTSVIITGGIDLSIGTGNDVFCHRWWSAHTKWVGHYG